MPNITQTEKNLISNLKTWPIRNFFFFFLSLTILFLETRSINMYIYKTSNCRAPYFHTVLELEYILFSMDNKNI